MSEYPALIISTDIVSLQKNISSCGIDVNIVIDQSELSGFIREYSSIRLSSPVALSNLSNLKRFYTKLLKFIEETEIPLICLASEDNFSSVFLSRFKTVKKVPEIIKKEADNPRFIKDSFCEGKVSEEDLVRYAVSYYPLLSVISKSNLPSKEKIRQFFI